MSEDFKRRWIVANAVFLTIGITLGAFHYPVEAEPECRGLICGGYGLALGAMTGAAVGLAQWYLLAPVLAVSNPSQSQEGRKPRILSWWLAATSAGFALGHGLGDAGVLVIVDLPFSVVVYGTVSGLIIGGFQALVLRAHVSRIHYWVLGSVIGFTVGLAFTGFLYFAASDSQGDLAPAIDYPFTLPVFGILQGLILGSIYALGTYWALGRTLPPELSKADQMPS